MKNTVQASETVVCVSDKVGSTTLREYPCGKKEKTEGMREGKTQTNEQKARKSNGQTMQQDHHVLVFTICSQKAKWNRSALSTHWT